MFTRPSEFWLSNDWWDFRKEMGFMGKIPYNGNRPELGMYRNYWGKTGANIFQTYQDKSFDDMNLGNRHFGHQNGIVLKKSSRLWRMTPMMYIIHGDIKIRPSRSFRHGGAFNHYNQYGIRGRRYPGWTWSNIFRMFNSHTKHTSPLLNVSLAQYLGGFHPWYCLFRAHWNYITWWIRPSQWNCFSYQWHRDGESGEPDWDSHQTYSFTYYNTPWAYLYHWFPIVWSEVRDSHYGWVANGYWDYWLNMFDPTFEFKETIPGLENRYNPYQITPQLLVSKWQKPHFFGNCDRGALWYAPTTMWEPPGGCNFYFYGRNSGERSNYKKFYMHMFKHKAGWTGSRNGEKFASCMVKQRQWYSNDIRRTNQGFGQQVGCKGLNWVYSASKKKCVKLVGCEVRNENQTGCQKCKQGYEIKVLDRFKGKPAWMGIQHFRKKKKLRNYVRSVEAGGSKSKCVQCSETETYSIIAGQCMPAMKARGLIYYIPPNTDMGTHYVYNIQRPKGKKAKSNSVTFDINISSHSNFKGIEKVYNRMVVETGLFYLAGGDPCKTPECYYKKRSFRPIRDGRCSFYDQGWHGIMGSMHGRGCPKGSKNHKRVFSDIYPEFKYANGKKYLRLMMTYNLAEYRPNYLVKIQFFQRSNNYTDFFVSKFNYRFDRKNAKGRNHSFERPDFQPHYFYLGSQYWDWQSRNMISAEEAKKTPVMGANKSLQVSRKKFKGKFAEEDYEWYQQGVKKGRKLPKSMRDLTIQFNYSWNAVQSWVQVHKRHKRSTNLPLFSVQVRATIDKKFKNLAVYADVKNGQMFLRYNSKKYGLTSKKQKINWRKWQFVGLGILYRNHKGLFQHCVTLFTTQTKNGAEKEKLKPALCLQAPAFYGNLKVSFGTDNVAGGAGKLYGKYYGYTIAYQMLHNDYFTERNIFLNFEQNTLDTKLMVKNFARKDSNDAILMTYGKDETVPYLFTDPTSPQPYWGIWSQPRSKGIKDMGPLEHNFYVTGNVVFEDNFTNYSAMGDNKFEVEVPIYRLVDKKGQDLIRLNHRVSYDPADRFIKRAKYAPGDINRYNLNKVKTYKRIKSRISTYARIYDPKTGRVPTDMNFDAMFPSYTVHLADFKKKKTKFMFNIFYRPLKNFYFKGRKFKREAVLLGIRHSWGCFKYMPMYTNKEYSNKHNKHFLAELNIPSGLMQYPVKHEWLSFAHTNGPAKACKVKWDPEHIGVGLHSMIYNTVYRSDNFDRMDLYSDPHATIKSQQQFWEQGTQGDNMSSSFSNGSSLACAHGFMLQMIGTTLRCSRPPSDAGNEYSESILYKDWMKTPRRYDYAFFKKLSGKETKFWTPFYHHYYNKYGLYDYYDQAKLYYKTKKDHPGCYISDTHAVRNVWHQIIRGKRWLKFQGKPRCVSCKKGWYMQKFSNLAWKYEGGWVCKKCTAPNCSVCARESCLKCKYGYTKVNGRCRLCKNSEVFDPVSKRCFGQKMNNYIDINYNVAYGDIIVADIFGIDKDMTAIINFDIDYAKQNEFGERIKVTPAVFQVTAIDGENE